MAIQQAKCSSTGTKYEIKAYDIENDTWEDMFGAYKMIHGEGDGYRAWKNEEELMQHVAEYPRIKRLMECYPLALFIDGKRAKFLNLH